MPRWQNQANAPDLSQGSDVEDGLTLIYDGQGGGPKEIWCSSGTFGFKSQPRR